MAPDKSKAISSQPLPQLVSFRTLGTLAIIFVFLWIALGIFHYFQARNQIKGLLTRQAEEMASMLALADQHVDQILIRLQEEQAARLLSTGAWLCNLDRQEHLDISQVEQIAKETDVFNIVVFNEKGQREYGLRGSGFGGRGGFGRGEFQRGGGGGGGFHAPEMVMDFINSKEPSRIQGIQKAGRFGEYRFSVFVRRPAGGAIMINTDTDDQDRLIQELGPESLLRKFAEKPYVVFLEQRNPDGKIIRYPQTNTSTKESISVTISPASTESPSLVAGFDASPLKMAERELWQWMILSIALAAFFILTAFLWTRFKRHHGSVAEALDQVRTYHRVVLEHMEDAVFAWNEQDGITFWNPRAAQLFPCLQACQTGQTIPIDLRQILNAVLQQNGYAIIDFPVENERKKYRAIITTVKETYSTNILFLTDVTAVERSTREKEQREHLQALAQVASGVAHEIRNPLNAIDMTIQALCTEPCTLPEEDRKTFQELRLEVARMNQMIEHFLAFGRPRSPELSETDMALIVMDTAHFLEPVCQGKKFLLRLEIASPLVIQADAQQLRQVFLNILLNAIEASEPNSVIQIEVLHENKKAIFRCIDQGTGMTEDEINHIFEPYFTTKSKGTGLGMSIVKRIIDAHNGTIEITSQINSGTQVLVAFTIDETAMLEKEIEK